MPVYAVIPLKPASDDLNASVERNIVEASSRHKLQANRGWLVKFDGTSVDLSNKLEITGQPSGVISPVGSAIVIPVSGYYGRGPTEMWEWLKARMEAG